MIARNQLGEAYATTTLKLRKRRDDFRGILNKKQGGITCGTIDEPRKSSKAIDERVIIDFRDKNVIIARFSDKNGGFLFYR